MSKRTNMGWMALAAVVLPLVAMACARSNRPSPTASASLSSPDAHVFKALSPPSRFLDAPSTTSQPKETVFLCVKACNAFSETVRDDDPIGPLALLPPDDPLIRDAVVRGRRLPMVANTGSSRVYPEQHGRVSYYKCWGKKMACGEIVQRRAIFAAHRTLPFGTVVRCTRKDTGASVVVVIKDRGPYVEGRILDLSHAAARRIGLIGPGLAECVVEVLAYPLIESMGPKGNG